MAAPTGSLARPCPVVACIDHSRALSRTEFDGLIGALQVYVDEYVVPVWGTPCELKQANGYLDDAWALVFLDDADHLPFARHDLTPTGRPHSKVDHRAPRPRSIRPWSCPPLAQAPEPAFRP